MTATLIALAIILLSLTGILSVSATFTVIYDKKWHSTVKVLWYEREISLNRILNFILFPDKAAKDARAKQKKKSGDKNTENKEAEKPETENSETRQTENKEKKAKAKKKPAKTNYIKKVFDEDGIVGFMLLLSNMFQSATNAINTLFRGFHIYSLYVKIIVGGGDAADIALKYGDICKYYYPLKGIVLNGMRVDEFDDLVVPDFIAPGSEYGLQLIGSISIATLLRIAFSATKTFLINMIQNNQSNK